MKNDLKNSWQYKAVENSSRFIKTPLDYCLNLNLKPNEVFILLIIESYSRQENNAYTGGIKGLQIFTNLSRFTIMRIIEKLCNIGLIGKVKSAGKAGYKILIDLKKQAKKQQLIEKDEVKFDSSGVEIW